MGHSHVFCKRCNCDFSVTHRGRTDVSQHEKTAKHKHWVEAQKHAQTMSDFITRNVTEADQVTRAEVKMAMLRAKNNVPFAFCDEFNKCVAEIFPDTAIARSTHLGKLGLRRSSKVSKFKLFDVRRLILSCLHIL